MNGAHKVHSNLFFCDHKLGIILSQKLVKMWISTAMLQRIEWYSKIRGKKSMGGLGKQSNFG